MRTFYQKSSMAIITLLILVASTAYPVTGQTPSADARHQRRIAQVVIALLNQQHFSQTNFDDELSGRAFDSLLKSIDTAKLYFHQSDVDEFSRYRLLIDDQINEGELSLGLEIFARFKKRAGESLKVIEELLATDFDFSVNESVVVDYEKRNWVADAGELRERWRKELKWRILAKEVDDAKQAESDDPLVLATEDGTVQEMLLREFKRAIRRRNEMTDDEVFEWYLNAVASSYDPHTSYMAPQTRDDFMIHIRSSLQGIGAELREHGDHVFIIRVMDGGGAAECGLVERGDRIVAVSEGEHGQWKSCFQKSTSDVANQIRGVAGTTVRLKLLSNSDAEKVAVIKRQKVAIKKEQASGEVVEIETSPTAKLKIGYVQLPGFYQDGEARDNGETDYRSCSRDVEKFLKQFNTSLVDAVVLDLRNNGGGVLSEAIQLVGLFIDQGPVVQVKAPSSDPGIYRDPSPGLVWKGPLVVLTNKSSASASEIVAGALQDYERAIVIGDSKTHGKGTVQTPLEISRMLRGLARGTRDMGALKLTVQKYYLPSGASTQRNGVAPGIVLPLSPGSLAKGEADLPNSLSSDQVNSVPFARYNLRTNSLLKQLANASAKRVQESEFFSTRTKQVKELEALRDSSVQSIEREQFKAHWDKITALSDSNTGDDGKDSAKRSFPRDPYDKEIVQIVNDYVDQLKMSNRLNEG